MRIPFLIFGLIFYLHVWGQSLNVLYNVEKCGLSYKQSSILLTNRKLSQGFSGTNQPALLQISNIPQNANIEKAYIWWDLAGKDTTQTIFVKNPNNLTQTFQANLIGHGNLQCSGSKGAAFRADITEIIEGNGSYFISGLPSDSSLDFNNFSDVNGATLMIIYSDNMADFVGKIIIKDGYLTSSEDTVIEVISGINYINEADTAIGTAFMLTSELENKQGNSIQMNGGAFIVYPQNFWDFEEKLTIFPSSSTADFGLRSPFDCGQMILVGIYFQQEGQPLYPEIIGIDGDYLSANLAPSFQWFLNGSAITNASFQNLLAAQSGNYFVKETTNYGCSFYSDTIQFTICTDRLKPNINFIAPDSLWTDSLNFDLQWFVDGNPISGETLPFIIAKSSGNYWVQTEDNTGCSVNSDIVSVFFVSENENPREGNKIKLYPSPNKGKFVLKIENEKFVPGRIEIFNYLGKSVFGSQIGEETSKISMDFPEGIYFLNISSGDNHETCKFVIK